MDLDRPPATTAGRHRATLLVFTLDAHAERARRRLLPSRLGGWEASLYRESLETALGAGRANGCGLAVCAPRRLRLPAEITQLAQEGSTFGARLRQAVARVEASPERPLVVVCSDTQELAPRHVGDALNRLAERPERLVVGPSADGGFYLLAAARPLVELLADVRWLRRDTLASLVAAAAARGIEVSLLEPLADLDRAADLDGWLKRRRATPSAWLERFLAVLRGLRRPLSPPVLGRPLPVRVPVRPARGPPR